MPYFLALTVEVFGHNLFLVPQEILFKLVAPVGLEPTPLGLKDQGATLTLKSIGGESETRTQLSALQVRHINPCYEFPMVRVENVEISASRSQTARSASELNPYSSATSVTSCAG
jgi:hypothetical protein